MDALREQAIIVGILYLLVIVVGLFSVSKVIDGPDYLKQTAVNSSQVKRAAVFQLLLAILYLFIAIILFSIVKTYNAQIALGFLGFRLLAVLFVLWGTSLLFRILKVSRIYAKASKTALKAISIKGDCLKSHRDVINHGAMIIALCMGSIAMNIVFYQSMLIVGWLAIWGIAAALLAIMASVLVLAKRLTVISSNYLLLNLPMALQEIVFAIYLIVIGFSAGF